MKVIIKFNLSKETQSKNINKLTNNCKNHMRELSPQELINGLPQELINTLLSCMIIEGDYPKH